MLFNNAGIIGILIVAVVVTISLVLHEIAHGYVALWNGDYTAKLNGRLTLNPLSHFNIVGFLMLMTVGFGYAKPVPVNPYNFKHQKSGIFTVAIAGIVTNLLLAFISVGGAGLMSFLAMKFPQSRTLLRYFQLFFSYMVTINISFALFNLLPIYPLDGFRIIEAFTRFNNPITKFFRDYGQFFLVGLVGISIIVTMLARYFPESYSIMQYFDILNLYIINVRNFIIDIFSKFWGLIF